MKKLNKKNVRVPKEVVINVRMTAQQKETLDAVAAGEGLGLSTWILHVGLLAAQDRQAKAER